MDRIYQRLKQRANAIAATYPRPVFYLHYAQTHRYSAVFFSRNTTVLGLKTLVSGLLTANMGHGLAHAEKVAKDAGTLALIEGRLAGYSKVFTDRMLLCAQAAGLLHDICRVEDDHARQGARMADALLRNHPFSGKEREDICRAIRNHEAFKENLPAPTLSGNILSDCLYDADKFRWGSDNLSHTLWDMLNYSNVPVERFLAHYPKGMRTLTDIRGTFRTRAGKKYGPCFIDTGIAIGNALYRAMEREFHLF